MTIKHKDMSILQENREAALGVIRRRPYQKNPPPFQFFGDARKIFSHQRATYFCRLDIAKHQHRSLKLVAMQLYNMLWWNH